MNADGTLDTGFDPNANTYVFSLAVQADGKVLLSGSFTTLQPNLAVAPISHNKLARPVNDPATQSLTIPSFNRVEWLRSGDGRPNLFPKSGGKCRVRPVCDRRGSECRAKLRSTASRHAVIPSLFA